MDTIDKDFLEKNFYYKHGKLFNKTDRNSMAMSNKRAGSKSGEYQIIRIDGKLYREHRLIFMMLHGCMPKEIDHISDKLTKEGIKDNRIENLRAVGHSANCQKRRRQKSSCRYKGVSYRPDGNKWQAQIKRNGKYIHLGRHDTDIEAAKAYDKKALELYGEHAGVNFKKEVCDILNKGEGE